MAAGREPLPAAIAADTSAAASARPSAVVRYFVAFAFLTYGFGKLTGAQFTMLDSQLDRPMGEVPGFWLAWYFFGYSTVYGSVIALLQIAGALLLTFRRTTLPGAVLLFGIASNIVLVDLFFGVDLGGLLSAIVLWACLLYILSCYAAQLRALLWDERDAGPPRAAGRAVAGHAVRVAMVAVAAGSTYWIANYNNRAPTPLDGRWRVVEASGFPADSVPVRVYFERNRAHMSVFQYPSSEATHHFEVDPRGRTIRIWERWLRKGRPIFSGAYVLSGGSLLLDGRLGTAGAPARLRLARVPQAR